VFIRQRIKITNNHIICQILHLSVDCTVESPVTEEIAVVVVAVVVVVTVAVDVELKVVV